MFEPVFEPPPGACDCHAHVFDPARFRYADARRYTPAPATVDDLMRLHDSLGLERVVLVQPSVYGTDNSCMLAALRRLGGRARGVAVIDRSITKGRLLDWYAQGVRGVRINLAVEKNTNASDAIHRLNETVESLGSTPMLIQILAELPTVIACSSTLRALEQRILIDHFGLAKIVDGCVENGFGALLDLVASPNVWMKLSGPYQISGQSTGYADVAPVAQTFIAAAPDRVVWGSDWPHTGGTNRLANYEATEVEPFRDEDDGHNLSLLTDWAPEPAALGRLLAGNPERLFGFGA